MRRRRDVSGKEIAAVRAPACTLVACGQTLQRHRFRVRTKSARRAPARLPCCMAPVAQRIEHRSSEAIPLPSGLPPQTPQNPVLGGTFPRLAVGASDTRKRRFVAVRGCHDTRDRPFAGTPHQRHTGRSITSAGARSLRRLPFLGRESEVFWRGTLGEHGAGRPPPRDNSANSRATGGSGLRKSRSLRHNDRAGL